MQAKNVMLLGFINKAVEYLDKNFDDETPNSRLAGLKNIDLATIKEELSENLDSSLGMMQSTMTSLLKAGEEAFYEFANIPKEDEKSFADLMANEFDVEPKKDNTKELANLLQFYSLDTIELDDEDETAEETVEEPVEETEEENDTVLQSDPTEDDLILEELEEEVETPASELDDEAKAMMEMIAKNVEKTSETVVEKPVNVQTPETKSCEEQIEEIFTEIEDNNTIDHEKIAKIETEDDIFNQIFDNTLKESENTSDESETESVPAEEEISNETEELDIPSEMFVELVEEVNSIFEEDANVPSEMVVELVDSKKEETVLEEVPVEETVTEEYIESPGYVDEGQKQFDVMMEELRLKMKKDEEEEAAIAEAKRIEEEKLAELKRLEEERLAEERRLEEERLAEEARIAEEKRLEEERLAEEARLAELRRLEEKRLEKERQLEEARHTEEAKLAEEARLAEEKRLEEERLEAEKAAEEANKVAKEVVEETTETTVEPAEKSYISDLIAELRTQMIREDAQRAEEERKMNEIYDEISKKYPYLPKSFVTIVYDLKDELSNAYPANEELILLNRIRFKNVENLRQFVEITLNHGYQINADEKKMIVDIFRPFVNSDGRIITNIFEVANQASLLEGEYEGYRVITED